MSVFAVSGTGTATLRAHWLFHRSVNQKKLRTFPVVNFLLLTSLWLTRSFVGLSVSEYIPRVNLIRPLSGVEAWGSVVVKALRY